MCCAQSRLIHSDVDDYCSASTPFSYPNQHFQGTIPSPAHLRPYVYAHKICTMQRSPSYLLLRHYHDRASDNVIPLRNTLTRRPRKPNWLRPVHGQHVFRKIPTPDPATWITPSEVSCSEAANGSSQSRPRLRVFGGAPASSKGQAERKMSRKNGLRRISHGQGRLLSKASRHEQLSNEYIKLVTLNSQSESISSSSNTRSESQSPCSPANQGTSSEDSSNMDHISSPQSSVSLPAVDNTRLESSTGRSKSTEGTKIRSKPSLQEARHNEPVVKADRSSPSQSSGAGKTRRPESANRDRLSHLTSTGDAHMVDISHKIPSRRSASATAFVLFSNPHPHACLTKKSLAKGDAIAVARIAGIQAAKKTADLIPLAHPGLGITRVQVDIELLDPSVENHDGYADVNLGEGGFEFGGVKITAHVSCDGKTGVEMEALTAANMAALTIYDMCKAVDKRMLITGVRVIMKRGGNGGHWSLDGQIPDDPPPSHVFEPVLQRRMAGIVDEAETHLPAEIPNPPSETAVANDLPRQSSSRPPPPSSTSSSETPPPQPMQARAPAFDEPTEPSPPR